MVRISCPAGPKSVLVTLLFTASSQSEQRQIENFGGLKGWVDCHFKNHELAIVLAKPDIYILRNFLINQLWRGG